MNRLVKKVFYMMLPMSQPVLPYTLDKNIESITVKGNKSSIGNDSLIIVSRRSYHTIGGLGSCPKV